MSTEAKYDINKFIEKDFLSNISAKEFVPRVAIELPVKWGIPPQSTRGYKNGDNG